jgi:RNA polymerase primary sigma factor
MSLDTYLSEIGSDRFAPLSSKEEKELLKAWPSEVCKRKLIEHNLRFAISFAKKFKGCPVSLEDLICSSNQGLCIAADRFDPSLGFRFISYAVWWIRQSIFGAISAERTIRLPGNVEEEIRIIDGIVGNYYGENGRYPSTKELCEISNFSLQRIESAQINAKAVLSLDYEGPGEDSKPVHTKVADENLLAPDEEAELSDLRAQIEGMMGTRLSDREIFVVRQYFGFENSEGESLESIGQTLGLTRERVRQIKLIALRKLKHPSNKIVRELVL